MNRKFITTSLFFISTSLLFLAGCGPENLNDADYLAQTAGTNIDGDLNKDDEADDAATPESDSQGPAAKPQGCPAGGCPVAGGGGGCATGNCEIPPDADTSRAVQLPDQVRGEPVKVTPTSERQLATDVIDYHTTRHIYQPSERHHTVFKHRNLERRHFTKIVYHPTMRRINRVVRSGSQSDQVMPVEEVVEPVIDYGCAAPAPIIRPTCGRGYFGGCGGGFRPYGNRLY